MPAADALEALGAASAQRTVWRAGLVVARTTVHSEFSPPRQPTPPELEGAAP
jgi:cytosine deaminase